MQKLYLTLILLAGYGVLIAQERQLSVSRDSSDAKSKTIMYTLSEDYTEIVNLEVDTMITKFQEYRVISDRTPFYSSLGNYGLPVEEIDFFKRTTDPDQFIYRYYKPYMHHRGNKTYIDTQVPFTELLFSFGGGRTEAEQTFKVRHSQNVNQFFNFGLDLDIINSLGQYSYQSTDDRFFTLHSSYLGKKYQIFGSWSLNSFNGMENGGISDISQIETLATRDLPTNIGGLSDATSIFKYKDLLIIQKFTVGGAEESLPDTLKSVKGSSVKGTFSHIFSWENGKKTFIDNFPQNEFYDTTYITGSRNSVPANDSLYSRSLRNTLRFDFTAGENRKVQLDIGVGIMNELNVYSQIRPTHDTILFADTLSWKESSNAVLGRISNRIGKNFGWDASGKLYFTGPKAGDLDIKGRIVTVIGSGKWSSELYGKGSFVNQGPSFWHKSWGSNNYEWNNDFEKELRINAGGGYIIPAVFLDLSLDFSLITNYIFFNNQSIPDQFSEPISVIALRLDKRFNFWKFRFDNRVLIQKSSHNDVLSLPLASIKSSLYFDHLFHFDITDGYLGFQIGAEGIYNTSYYASAYMPSTGTFYNQQDIELGNYPYINAFINLKLKRTRFFFKFEHVNHGMAGMSYNYSYVPDYYMPVRMFKYGIAWTFYD